VSELDGVNQRKLDFVDSDDGIKEETDNGLHNISKRDSVITVVTNIN
jgi:hypothetical protein